MLEDLIISKTRVKLLELFLTNPGKILHVRELVRRVDEEINAVRRELAHMEKHGLVSKEPRGNRLYYTMRRDYPLYDELTKIMAKTRGLGADILKNRMKLGKVRYIVFSGRFVRRTPKIDPDQVDITVVGDVVLPELALLIRAEEARRTEEINYTVMTDEEFDFRKKRRDPFIVSILKGARVIVIGDEEEFLH